MAEMELQRRLICV